MIKRIVRMRFRKQNVPRFLEIFRESCDAIRAFEGCRYLELLQDEEDPAMYFTISIWESPQALEAYRKSELFAKTWRKTKQLFKKPAKAWSTTSYLIV